MVGRRIFMPTAEKQLKAEESVQEAPLKSRPSKDDIEISSDMAHPTESSSPVAKQPVSFKSTHRGASTTPFQISTRGMERAKEVKFNPASADMGSVSFEETQNPPQQFVTPQPRARKQRTASVTSIATSIGTGSTSGTESLYPRSENGDVPRRKRGRPRKEKSSESPVQPAAAGEAMTIRSAVKNMIMKENQEQPHQQQENEGDDDGDAEADSHSQSTARRSGRRRTAPKLFENAVEATKKRKRRTFSLEDSQIDYADQESVGRASSVDSERTPSFGAGHVTDEDRMELDDNSSVTSAPKRRRRKRLQKQGETANAFESQKVDVANNTTLAEEEPPQGRQARSRRSGATRRVNLDEGDSEMELAGEDSDSPASPPYKRRRRRRRHTERAEETEQSIPGTLPQGPKPSLRIVLKLHNSTKGYADLLAKLGPELVPKQRKKPGPKPGFKKLPGYIKPGPKPGYNKPGPKPGYNKPGPKPGYNKPGPKPRPKPESNPIEPETPVEPKPRLKPGPKPGSRPGPKPGPKPVPRLATADQNVHVPRRSSKVPDSPVVPESPRSLKRKSLHPDLEPEQQSTQQVNMQSQLPNSQPMKAKPRPAKLQMTAPMSHVRHGSQSGPAMDPGETKEYTQMARKIRQQEVMDALESQSKRTRNPTNDEAKQRVSHLKHEKHILSMGIADALRSIVQRCNNDIGQKKVDPEMLKSCGFEMEVKAVEEHRAKKIRYAGSKKSNENEKEKEKMRLAAIQAHRQYSIDVSASREEIVVCLKLQQQKYTRLLDGEPKDSESLVELQEQIDQYCRRLGLAEFGGHLLQADPRDILVRGLGSTRLPVTNEDDLKFHKKNGRPTNWKTDDAFPSKVRADINAALESCKPNHIFRNVPGSQDEMNVFNLVDAIESVEGSRLEELLEDSDDMDVEMDGAENAQPEMETEVAQPMVEEEEKFDLLHLLARLAREAEPLEELLVPDADNSVMMKEPASPVTPPFAPSVALPDASMATTSPAASQAVTFAPPQDLFLDTPPVAPASASPVASPVAFPVASPMASQAEPQAQLHVDSPAASPIASQATAPAMSWTASRGASPIPSPEPLRGASRSASPFGLPAESPVDVPIAPRDASPDASPEAVPLAPRATLPIEAVFQANDDALSGDALTEEPVTAPTVVLPAALAADVSVAPVDKSPTPSPNASRAGSPNTSRAGSPYVFRAGSPNISRAGSPNISRAGSPIFSRAGSTAEMKNSSPIVTGARSPIALEAAPPIDLDVPQRAASETSSQMESKPASLNASPSPANSPSTSPIMSPMNSPRMYPYDIPTAVAIASTPEVLLASLPEPQAADTDIDIHEPQVADNVDIPEPQVFNDGDDILEPLVADNIEMLDAPQEEHREEEDVTEVAAEVQASLADILNDVEQQHLPAPLFEADQMEAPLFEADQMEIDQAIPEQPSMEIEEKPASPTALQPQLAESEEMVEHGLKAMDIPPEIIRTDPITETMQEVPSEVTERPATPAALPSLAEESVLMPLDEPSAPVESDQMQQSLDAVVAPVQQQPEQPLQVEQQIQQQEHIQQPERLEQPEHRVEQREHRVEQQEHRPQQEHHVQPEHRIEQEHRPQQEPPVANSNIQDTTATEQTFFPISKRPLTLDTTTPREPSIKTEMNSRGEAISILHSASPRETTSSERPVTPIRHARDSSSGSPTAHRSTPGSAMRQNQTRPAPLALDSRTSTPRSRRKSTMTPTEMPKGVRFGEEGLGQIITLSTPVQILNSVPQGPKSAGPILAPQPSASAPPAHKPLAPKRRRSEAPPKGRTYPLAPLAPFVHLEPKPPAQPVQQMLPAQQMMSVQHMLPAQQMMPAQQHLPPMQAPQLSPLEPSATAVYPSYHSEHNFTHPLYDTPTDHRRRSSSSSHHYAPGIVLSGPPAPPPRSPPRQRQVDYGHQPATAPYPAQSPSWASPSPYANDPYHQATTPDPNAVDPRHLHRHSVPHLPSYTGSSYTHHHHQQQQQQPYHPAPSPYTHHQPQHAYPSQHQGMDMARHLSQSPLQQSASPAYQGYPQRSMSMFGTPSVGSGSPPPLSQSPHPFASYQQQQQHAPHNPGAGMSDLERRYSYSVHPSPSQTPTQPYPAGNPSPSPSFYSAAVDPHGRAATPSAHSNGGGGTPGPPAIPLMGMPSLLAQQLFRGEPHKVYIGDGKYKVNTAPPSNEVRPPLPGTVFHFDKLVQQAEQKFAEKRED